MICSEAHWTESLRAHVALRRASTGERFETAPALRAVFAGIDNRWPPAETIVSPLAVCDVPETVVSQSAARATFETTISPAAAATLETGVSPWIAAGISRATWFRRRKDETGVSRASAAKPWIAAGVSRASWYRHGKPQGVA
jgi:hypothetical protein